jgi:hypothetical protein
VLRMVDAHKGVLVIELYFVSFDEHADNDDEYEDDNDGENSRIDWDDPYWEEVFELDLFDEDNNPPRPSMVEGNVEEGNEGDEKDNEGDGEDEGEDGGREE